MPFEGSNTYLHIITQVLTQYKYSYTHKQDTTIHIHTLNQKVYKHKLLGCILDYWTDIFLVFTQCTDLIDPFRLRGLREPAAIVKSKQYVDINNQSQLANDHMYCTS